MIQALEGELQEGTEVVTNVITGAVRQTCSRKVAQGFPGLGGGRQGGFPGGGSPAVVAAEAADGASNVVSNARHLRSRSRSRPMKSAK